MSAQDKKQIEKVNARNAVEEYVYEMRDKLEDAYNEFISEQVCVSVLCCGYAVLCCRTRNLF